MRTPLLGSAVGHVLEVAASTGANLAHFPAGVDVVAIDLSAGMLAKAPWRGAKKLAVIDAERVAFMDGSFDTVVSTLAICTFADPVQALREMQRVCRSDGHILFLELGGAAIQESQLAWCM